MCGEVKQSRKAGAGSWTPFPPLSGECELCPKGRGKQCELIEQDEWAGGVGRESSRVGSDDQEQSSTLDNLIQSSQRPWYCTVTSTLSFYRAGHKLREAKQFVQSRMGWGQAQAPSLCLPPLCCLPRREAEEFGQRTRSQEEPAKAQVVYFLFLSCCASKCKADCYLFSSCSK